MAVQSLINVLRRDDVTFGSFVQYNRRKEKKPPTLSIFHTVKNLLPASAHHSGRGAAGDVHDMRLPGPSDLYNILQTRSEQRLRL